VDLLNALQRFPGEAEVVSAGPLSVSGVTVIDGDGECWTPTKGTKGAGGSSVGVAPPSRRGRRAMNTETE